MGLTASGSKNLLEIDFFARDGSLLSRVRCKGTVSEGFFGVSNKSGIDQAIKKVAEYAASIFRK